MAAALAGFVALGTLTAAPASAVPYNTNMTIVGSSSGRCIDRPNGSHDNGTQLQLFDCNGVQAAQNWQYTNDKQLWGPACMDASNWGKTNGTPVVMWGCGYPVQANEQWDFHGDGTITNVNAPGMCLDAYNGGTSNYTKLVLWSCNGQDNQKWSYWYTAN
ncbi:RICIN domain-containing protein [Streptomyces sp. NPDC096040]|uniref:RICIN domain-containing protein n=1 Tax=Streptomyces sp. NPDC096040 TaxID=3155541 RepID=UPI00332F5D3B